MTRDFLRILSFFSFPAFVFLLNLIFAYVLNFYDIFLWIDIPVHFLGGLAVGHMFILFFNFFEKKNLIKIKSELIFFILLISLVCFMGVLWEFYEFLMINLFGCKWQEEVANVLLDLFMGIFGGGVSFVLFRKL